MNQLSLFSLLSTQPAPPRRDYDILVLRIQSLVNEVNQPASMVNLQAVHHQAKLIAERAAVLIEGGWRPE